MSSRFAGDIGTKLRQRRRALGLSQRQIASSAHCSTSALSAIELGKTRPNPALVRSLALALGIDPAQLEQDVEAARAATDRRRAHRGTVGLIATLTPLAPDINDFRKRWDSVAAGGFVEPRTRFLMERLADELDHILTSTARADVAGKRVPRDLALFVSDVVRVLPHRQDLVRGRARLYDQTSNWLCAANDYEAALVYQQQHGALNPEDLLRSAVQLLVMGQYDDAGKRLAFIRRQVRRVESGPFGKLTPQKANELSLQAASFQVWVRDYLGDQPAAFQMLRILYATRLAEQDQAFRAFVMHRAGRLRVENGARYLELGRRVDGIRDIEMGQSLLRKAKDLSDEQHIASGTRPNPFGELWLTRSRLLTEPNNTLRLIAAERERLVDRPDLTVHIDLANARQLRAKGQRMSSVEFEQIEQHLAQAVRAHNVRTALDLILVSAEAAAHRTGAHSKHQAAARFAAAATIADQIRHPLRHQISGRLAAITGESTPHRTGALADDCMSRYGLESLLAQVRTRVVLQEPLSITDAG